MHTNNPLLTQKLNYYGIRGVTRNLLESYLESRQQTIYWNKEYFTTKENNIEISQAAFLGPILFIIYTNDLPKNIDGESTLQNLRQI